MKRGLLFLCGFFCLIAAAFAAGHGRMAPPPAFEGLPVLQDGRVKPLDSFARVELRQIYGHETPPGGGSPAGWLAQVLFDPARAGKQKLFTIRDAGLREQFGLKDGGAETLYSLDDVSAGLAATEGSLPALLANGETLTPPQKELLDLHNRAVAFSQLLGSLSMILPLQNMPAEKKDRRFAEGPTWLELRKEEEGLRARLKKIVKRKGDDLSRYAPDEMALALAGLSLSELRNSGKTNTRFRIVPPQWAGSGEWLSPWANLESGQGSPQAAAYLSQWQDMAQAWRAGDSQALDKAAREAMASVTAQAQDGAELSVPRLRLERFYNRLKPFYRAEILYAAAIVLLLIGAARGTARAQYVALALTVTGAVLQAGGLLMRVVILARPPVGTLYESLLFVSLIVLLGALVAARGKDGAALRGGLGVTLGILLAAPVIAPQGDSLEMLVAVLNTNFWLATHVICITAGYGVSILAATLAHIALVRRAAPDRVLHAALAAALFLTAFGTTLGGIWADQSWGRFWGWDPKENGALLIVLWIAWLLHGRWGGHLKGAWFLAAAAVLNVVVALSWFGVNLLSIGLHSYGFTSGVAAGFAVFCIGDMALIAALTARARLKIS